MYVTIDRLDARKKESEIAVSGLAEINSFINPNMAKISVNDDMKLCVNFDDKWKIRSIHLVLLPFQNCFAR